MCIHWRRVHGPELCVQALSHPRGGPGEQRDASSESSAGDSEIAPYHLHQVVATLAPDNPEVQRAATLAAATSTPGRLAADSMASSLRHQVRAPSWCGAGRVPVPSHSGDPSPLLQLGVLQSMRRVTCLPEHNMLACTTSRAPEVTLLRLTDLGHLAVLQPP